MLQLLTVSGVLVFRLIPSATMEHPPETSDWNFNELLDATPRIFEIPELNDAPSVALKKLVALQVHSSWDPVKLAAITGYGVSVALALYSPYIPAGLKEALVRWIQGRELDSASFNLTWTADTSLPETTQRIPQVMSIDAGAKLMKCVYGRNDLTEEHFTYLLSQQTGTEDCNLLTMLAILDFYKRIKTTGDPNGWPEGGETENKRLLAVCFTLRRILVAINMHIKYFSTIREHPEVYRSLEIYRDRYSEALEPHCQQCVAPDFELIPGPSSYSDHLPVPSFNPGTAFGSNPPPNPAPSTDGGMETPSAQPAYGSIPPALVSYYSHWQAPSASNQLASSSNPTSASSYSYSQSPSAINLLAYGFNHMSDLDLLPSPAPLEPIDDTRRKRQRSS